MVPMATVNLFYDPAFRTARSRQRRARPRYAVQKTLARDGPRGELGAKIFVLWGGRGGVETDACRRPDEAVKRLREAVNYLCRYSLDKKYGFTFAMEAKPNEPRGDIYMATTGAYLGFIPTLDHPELVGVNPEVAHEQMSGLNFLHAIAQAWEMGKLFHIDLNDQAPGRYDQDYRFGAANIKAAFWLVKFWRTWATMLRATSMPMPIARGLRRRPRLRARLHADLLILKERGERWHADAESRRCSRTPAGPPRRSAPTRRRTRRRCSRSRSIGWSWRGAGSATSGSISCRWRFVGVR